MESVTTRRNCSAGSISAPISRKRSANPAGTAPPNRTESTNGMDVPGRGWMIDRRERRQIPGAVGKLGKSATTPTNLIRLLRRRARWRSCACVMEFAGPMRRGSPEIVWRKGAVDDDRVRLAHIPCTERTSLENIGAVGVEHVDADMKRADLQRYRLPARARGSRTGSGGRPQTREYWTRT